MTIVSKYPEAPFNILHSWINETPPIPVQNTIVGKRCPKKSRWDFFPSKHKFIVTGGPIMSNKGVLYIRLWRFECENCGQYMETPSKVAFAPGAGCLHYPSPGSEYIP